jgi:hypothetical protein
MTTPDTTQTAIPNQASGRPVLYSDGLSIGQELDIRWTSCGAAYAAYGPVTKINKKSIKVRLERELSGYPAGFEVTIPIPGTAWNGAWYRAEALPDVEMEARTAECARAEAETAMNWTL